MDSNKGEGKKVYEIGYLLVSSVPPEKVTDILSTLKGILSKGEAVTISLEAPELMSLAYTMIKKIGTVNHRFDQAYFGWIKFEVSGNKIEDIKKAFEMHPDMLRMLLITTIRENTYLGKKAIAAPILANVMNTAEVVGTDQAVSTVPLEVKLETKSRAVEDMDKSIDEMVKEA